MDLSIAYALYFAARGQGVAQASPSATPEPYATTARVLFSGLGADELFGGYTRHATAFSRGGHAGLAQELLLDVGRLGKRNLGRDDRAMSHWGREVRFPFLDEDLVRYIIGLPVWEKCDFENTGDDDTYPEAPKRVLRLLAQKLGMNAVALEKKRAVGTQDGRVQRFITNILLPRYNSVPEPQRWRVGEPKARLWSRLELLEAASLIQALKGLKPVLSAVMTTNRYFRATSTKEHVDNRVRSCVCLWA